MVVIALVLGVFGTACAADNDATGPAVPLTPTSSSGADHAGADQENAHPDSSALPSGHVHGVAVNPADANVYLATHDGLFRYDQTGPERVGPVIDLMGFTVAGHPGPGVDLPQPVGLIESTDAGRSWVPLSRQGESDFHTLTASKAGVAGFDGALRVTQNGKDWRTLNVPAAPYALAASPDGRVLLATTETGLLRSSDKGESWAAVEQAPLLMLVDWADADTVAGIEPDGTVAISDDAGASWTRRGRAGGTPQALAASLPTKVAAGRGLDLFVVTDATVVRSSNGGHTFAPLTH